MLAGEPCPPFKGDRGCRRQARPRHAATGSARRARRSRSTCTTTRSAASASRRRLPACGRTRVATARGRGCCARGSGNEARTLRTYTHGIPHSGDSRSSALLLSRRTREPTARADPTGAATTSDVLTEPTPLVPLGPLYRTLRTYVLGIDIVKSAVLCYLDGAPASRQSKANFRETLG